MSEKIAGLNLDSFATFHLKENEGTEKKWKGKEKKSKENEE